MWETFRTVGPQRQRAATSLGGAPRRIDCSWKTSYAMRFIEEIVAVLSDGLEITLVIAVVAAVLSVGFLVVTA